MSVQSQSVDLELEGLFESPHDDPPRWAFMLTLYVDETIDQNTGMCVVAGYLGKKKHWKKYIKAWPKELGQRKSLHLSSMYLGSNCAPRKYGNLLERLGTVPRQCGLKPFVGSICEQDYKHLVSGTVLEVLMEGYVLAILALMDRLPAHIPVNERVEVIFEQQLIHAAQRERAMICWGSQPQFRTKSGKHILAKWSSIQKCILTEASDYLCYALHQRDVDRSSQKAILTAPILDAQRYVRNHQGKAVVEKWLREITASRKRPIPRLTRENKRIVRSL